MNINRYLFLIAVLLAILVVASGIPVPLIANAAKYAQVSREIIENHDWINLKIGGDAYDQKPPLLFWLGALCFSIFGVTITGYKLSVILVSLLGIWSTYKLATLLFGKKTGILSAIFWLTSLGYLHFHNDIHTDTLLATVVVFTVWQLSLYFRYKKWHQFFLGIAGVGLAMLTKGPVGLAIPAFAIGTELILRKKFKEILHWRWLLALLIIGVVISPALLGLVNQFGAEGIKFYFWTNNMGRITGSYYGTNTDPFFYLHTAIYILAPWSLFSITGIILEIRQLILRKESPSGKADLINLGAIIPYLLILSVAKTKNPHYMLEIAPFMLILGARWTILIFENEIFTRLKKILSASYKVIAILLWAVILIPPFFFFPEKRIVYWIILGPLLISAVYFLLIKADLRRQVLMLAITIAGFLFMVNVSLFMNMMQFQSSRNAAALFNQEAKPDATLNIYGRKARLWDLFLYSKKPGRYLMTNDDLKNFLPHKGAWIYTDEKGYSEMRQMGIDMELLKAYRHKTMTNQSLKFLNPKTREQNFDTMYLVRLN